MAMDMVKVVITYEHQTKRIKGLFEATTILHDEIHASV